MKNLQSLNYGTFTNSPDTVERIIDAVRVTPEPLPGHPTHGRGQRQAIVQPAHVTQTQDREKQLQDQHLARRRIRGLMKIQ